MRALFLVLLGTTFSSHVRADDWPHWMGPKRDNVWRETGILESFPKGGPKILWRAEVAGGYAGPAVASGKVFVTDYVTKDNVKVDNFARKEYSGIERVLCIDEKTGKQLWQHSYPVKYAISYPAGPRCTPTVDGDKVYTLGAEGNLFCFQVSDGKVLWEKDLKKEYNTKSALWGYAAHPLIDGKKLITLAGGAGSHVVAFDKETGKELWKAETSPEQGYSPPTIIEAAGVRQLLLLRPDAVTAVDPETGKRLWTTPYSASNGSIIMSPIVYKDYLYVAGYSNKNLMLKLTQDKPGVEVLWQDKPRIGISPVNVQPFEENGIIYGFDQNGRAYAIEIPSGKRLWETTEIVGGDRAAGSETAFIVKQAGTDRFWFFTERGDLVIGKLSKEGYTEISRANVIKQTNVAFGRDVIWCMPAYANKHAYIRNDNELICIDLSK